MVDLPTSQVIMPTPKKPRCRVDRDHFYVARCRAGLTHKQAADMLHVTTRTLRNWENGESQIPYAAFRLMRLFGGYSLVGQAWEGWTVHKNVLYSPAGRGFEPYHLNYLSNYLWMARQWLKERKTLKTSVASATQKPYFAAKPLLRASEVTASLRRLSAEGFRYGAPSDASASFGAEVRQVNHGFSATVAGLHEKKQQHLKFGNSADFRTIAEAANDVLNWEVE